MTPPSIQNFLFSTSQHNLRLLVATSASLVKILACVGVAGAVVKTLDQLFKRLPTGAVQAAMGGLIAGEIYLIARNVENILDNPLLRGRACLTTNLLIDLILKNSFISRPLFGNLIARAIHLCQ